MATPTDPTFGAGFDGDAFRAAIRSTMEMGMPEDTNERVTFRWHTERTYVTADPGGNPYSWDETPASELAHDDVQVPCAVNFSARPAGSVDTTLGQFDTARISLTLLDVDYTQVEGADTVLIDNNIYVIDFVGPPQGLFDVTVYTIFATAQDET